MKKLLALLLAALLLLSMPLPRARAEEEEPVEAPPAAQTPADPDPTAAPTAAPAATAAPVETEEPAPTAETTPAPTAAPAPAEEPEPTEEPEETPETSNDHPRNSKSLKYWEKQRASITLTGELREDILIIAQSQLGYSADSTYYEESSSGKKRYYTRYGDWYGTKFCDWCDVFVSFCIFYAGNETYPAESSCGRHMLNLKREGYWREWNSYVPEKGDIVFFSFKSENTMPTHVGLVEEVIPAEDGKPGQLVTIEGNQRNPDGKTPCVRRMVRDLDSVVGYGTYERGKTYPEAYTVRSNGFTIIDEDSIYFVEYPTKAAMAFLGLVNSRYYAHWFPEESAAEEEAQEEMDPLTYPIPEYEPEAVPQTEEAESPEPEADPAGEEAEPVQEPEQETEPAPKPERPSKPPKRPQPADSADVIVPEPPKPEPPKPGRGRPGMETDSQQ